MSDGQTPSGQTDGAWVCERNLFADVCRKIHDPDDGWLCGKRGDLVEIAAPPVPGSGTPGDELPRINCSKTAFRTENHDAHEHDFDGDTRAWCRGLDMPALRPPAPSTPVDEADGQTTHDLKCWPEFFEAIEDGTKTFEVRFDDRDIKVGDLLRIREWSETFGYTRSEVTREVTFRLPIEDAPGFPPLTAPPTLPEIHGAEWVVLGLAPPAPPVSPPVAGGRMVKFFDPAVNEEVRLTVREAAAVILALQDQQTRDPDWEDTRSDEPTPVSEWLRLALDGEGYAEHVEACVLPRCTDPHVFTPDADGDCTVCFDTFDDGPHLPSAAPPVGEGRRLDEGERSQSEQWFVVHHNALRSLRYGTFPIERLARASIAACSCGPHTLRHTVTTTYTASSAEEFVAAAADREEEA